MSKGKKIGIIAGIAAALAITAVVLLIVLSGGKKNKLIGRWEAVDSNDYIAFYSDGTTYSNMYLELEETAKYSFSGDDIIFYDEVETYLLRYSPEAKEDGNFWYMEDGRLYIFGRCFKKADEKL